MSNETICHAFDTGDRARDVIAACLFKDCQEKQLKSTSAVGTGTGTQKSAFTRPNPGGSVGPGARKMTADLQPLPRLADMFLYTAGMPSARHSPSAFLFFFFMNISTSSTNQTRRTEPCGEVTPVSESGMWTRCNVSYCIHRCCMRQLWERFIRSEKKISKRRHEIKTRRIPSIVNLSLSVSHIYISAAE